MTGFRLLDIERTKAPVWTGSTALVVVRRDECLRCGGNLREWSYGQLPLFRSHGHGAVKRTSLRECDECGLAFVTDVTEVNPRSYGL